MTDRILIAGGAGFIGQQLQLKSKDVEIPAFVYALDRTIGRYRNV